ncbi:MAG: prepilin-type N-terminal cleavage/methylation domain-containing protein [Clostridiales bacterium]|nr:prepilin-type N-terminal cleavage/methylation domain-containing protein [Clostridiales bacterium]
MKKKGFTLIETMISLFIFSIIVFLVLDFYGFNERLNKNLIDDSNDLLNGYIAVDFISDTIRKNKIEIIDKNQNGRCEIIKTTDGQTLYLKGSNGILRYASDSQQITINILDVKVEKIRDKLYKVAVTTKTGRKILMFTGEKQ